MENIRNLTGRIKSCMACNEDQCPAIRERLDQHAISYHSTFRPLGQDIELVQKFSGTLTQTGSLIPITNSDENTSTSDLTVQKLNSFTKPNYKEILEAEILEWAKDLPEYLNPSAEILKQNIIKDLIERIHSMSSEINEDYYGSNLAIEINNFLDSLPVYSNTWESESAVENLKENLVNRILEVNRKNYRSDINISKEHKQNSKLKVKQNITSSTQTPNDSEKYKETQNNKTKMPQKNSNDDGIHFDGFRYQNKKYDGSKLIDAQVQDSFSTMTPYFGTIYGQPKIKMSKQKIEIKDEIYKQIILKWLMQGILKSNRNIEQSDKKVLTDVLYNRLSPLLAKNYTSAKHKLLMKREILNFLYDYFRDSYTTNATYFNNLVEDVATKLLIQMANAGEFLSKSHTAYLYNHIDHVFEHNVEPEHYFKPIFYKVVTDAVRNLIPSSDAIENDICQLLLHNIHWIRLGYNHNIQTDLFVLLRSSTDLCDQKIEDIISSIMGHLTYILCYNNINNSAKKPPWSDIYSIYTSQHKLPSPDDIRPFTEHNTAVVHNQDSINKITTENYVTPACCEPSTNEVYELEDTLKELIAKYIEHMSHVENLIARQAFSRILQTELQELSTTITRDSYNGFIDNDYDLKPVTKNLYQELKYINIISDWLKLVPLHESFNRVGNRTRIEMVIKLAEKIIDIEKNRVILPAGTDFNMYLMSLINKYTEQLPILSNYRKNMHQIIHDLIMKISGFLSLSPSFDNFNSTVSSTNSTNIPNQQLSEVIEQYIRFNCVDLSEDELKLEALSARLAKEIQKLNCANPTSGNHSKLYQKLAKKPLWMNKIVKRFCLELKFIEQISNWLNNLPLFSITDKNSNDVIVKMVSNLARKMSEWENRISNSPQVATDLKEYITQWILELPIELSKDFDLETAMQQLINRMERVHRENHLKKEIVLTSMHNDTNDICKFPHSCCNKSTVNNQQKQDPSTDIVQSIENWSANLPVLTESENVSSVIKNRVATKLYQKVSELNTKPEYFTDNITFQEILSEEIDTQLQNLPQSPNLENVKEDLKQNLVSLIMGKRMEMREKASGTEYKHELEKTIELSLPNPRQRYQHESPGFKIYKDRLASLFILENFDYSFDITKESYEKRIKKEIAKYYLDIRNSNSIPLTNKQFFNELYSALFNVPLPNDKYISEEVEEIKTRCEIDKWIETIPLKATTRDDEILEKDQILAMLSKRLYKMEKYDQNSESKMQKEITKWLLKLPLLPGQKGNINEFVSKLLLRLRSTLETRKCIKRNINIDEYIMKERSTMKRILDTNQIDGQNINKVTKPFEKHATTSCVIPRSSSSLRRPADLLSNIVEMWCDELPLLANTTQEINNLKDIKDNLVIKIIMKISELNINPETFNDDFLYDILLDDELENIVSTLSTSVEFLKSKNIRKTQLKNAIKTILPLIKKDKARYEYKQELKNVVDTVLLKSQNEIKNNAHYIILKDDIVDHFIMYNNEIGSFLNKILIHNDVYKYFSEILKSQNMPPNLLIIGNKLLCEMDKIPVINNAAIAEEIQEIRIKFEIIEFLEGLSLSGDEDKLMLKNQMVSALAKRLSELCEISSSENRHKMKNEIIKYLQKLGSGNIDPQNVDVLVENILNLQMPDISHHSQNLNPCTDIKRNTINSQTLIHQTPIDVNNNESKDEQWMSLLSITPNDFNCYEKEVKKELNNSHRSNKNLQMRQDIEYSDRYSEIDYPNFERRIALTSSMINNQSDLVRPSTPPKEPYITVVPNQNKTHDSTYLNGASIARNSLNSAMESQEHRGEILQEDLYPSSEEINLVSPLSNHKYIRDSCTQHQNPIETSHYDQQNISTQLPPYNGLIQKLLHQNPIGKQHMLQKISNQTSNPDNRITQFSPPVQKHYSKNEYLGPQTKTTTFQQDPNLVPSNIDQPYSFEGILNSEITSSNKYNPNSRERNNISSITPLTPVRQISKAKISFRNTKEPSPFAIPSQPSPSTAQFTPTQTTSQNLFSASSICRSCRRPSITFFKPTDMISESYNSDARLSQTEEREQRMNIFPPDDNDENKCICGSKRKRHCKCRKQVCRMHMRKNCKICSSMNHFYCSMPPCRYPGFYYY